MPLIFLHFMDIVYGALAKKVASVFLYWYSLVVACVQASKRLGEWGKKRGRYSLSPLAWCPSRSFIQISFYIACVVGAKRGGEGRKKMGRGISPRSPLFQILLLFPLLDYSFWRLLRWRYLQYTRSKNHESRHNELWCSLIVDSLSVWFQEKQSTLLICALVRLVVTPCLFFFNNLLRHSTGRLEKP